MTSCDMCHVNGFVCVSQSITKERTLGQKDCTILETREVRERSGVFMLKIDHSRGDEHIMTTYSLHTQ